MALSLLITEPNTPVLVPNLLAHQLALRGLDAQSAPSRTQLGAAGLTSRR